MQQVFDFLLTESRVPYDKNSKNGTAHRPFPTNSQSAEESAADTVYSDPLYRVIDQNGEDIPHKAERKDGVLTVTVDADFASLTGSLGCINAMIEQGIDTIVFVTNGASSAFALSDLLAQGSTGDSYTLIHDGDAVSFTLSSGADLGNILK